MCRSWKQTKHLGVMNLLLGTPRPPGHLMKLEPEGWQAALLRADLRLCHDCRHHLLGASLQSQALHHTSQTDVFSVPGSDW